MHYHPCTLIENTVPHTATTAPIRQAFQILKQSLGRSVQFDAARVGSYAHRLRSYWSNLCDMNALRLVVNTYERDASLSLQEVLGVNRAPQVCTRVKQSPWYAADLPGEPFKVLPTLVERHDSWNWSITPRPKYQSHRSRFDPGG